MDNFSGNKYEKSREDAKPTPGTADIAVIREENATAIPCRSNVTSAKSAARCWTALTSGLILLDGHYSSDVEALTSTRIAS